MNEIIHADHIKQTIPVIQCNTDSHQLYDAVHSIRPIEDKRLRADMAILREMLEKQELKEINWISNKKQLADSLTKLGASSKKLLDTFIHRKLL